MIGRLIGAALAFAMAQNVAAQTLRPDQARFREIYKQLVETNTALVESAAARWPPTRWATG